MSAPSSTAPRTRTGHAPSPTGPTVYVHAAAAGGAYLTRPGHHRHFRPPAEFPTLAAARAAAASMNPTPRVSEGIRVGPHLYVRTDVPLTWTVLHPDLPGYWSLTT